jgi:DNA-binding NtrC family response regulator
MAKILIAEDVKVTRIFLSRVLQKEGFEVIEASDGKEALELFKKESPSAVILDLQMPVMSGVEVITELKNIAPRVPVIIATAYGDISTAVDIMKMGAYDFLVKPVEPGKLIVTINRAVEKLNLEMELQRLQTAEDVSLEWALGKSLSAKKIIEQLKHVAPTNFSIIIQGETGTGKTVLAKMLHDKSLRAGKEFVKIDVSNIPETIIESEFFGYEKGAFTGAVGSRKGFFETANGGTIFIDEIENLSPLAQSKLLTVIESREIYRLGSRKPVPLDIRVIAATNSDMQKTVMEGKFREDLFFRLGEFIITLPTLRERRDDIPAMASKFIEEACLELNKPAKAINKKALDRLSNYRWPGNIRELKNTIRRAALLSGDAEITEDHIGFLLGTGAEEQKDYPLMPLRDAVGGIERKIIAKALEATKGNRAQAASILMIDAKTLRTKIKEYDL